jgi:hypothetical protein
MIFAPFVVAGVVVLALALRRKRVEPRGFEVLPPDERGEDGREVAAGRAKETTTCDTGSSPPTNPRDAAAS